MINKSVDEKTEKFHGTDSCSDLVSVIFINPDNGVALGHDNFPDDLLGDVIGVEEPVLRYPGGVIPLFEFDKLPRTHPQVINMPSLENIPKILPKQQPLEPPLTINHINPQTPVHIGHRLKRLPQRPRLMNFNITPQVNRLKQRRYRNVVIGFCMRLIRDP